MVRPDRADQIERSIIARYQAGQIKQQIQEDQIINYLEQANDQKHKPTVEFQRKKGQDDDDFFKDDDDGGDSSGDW
uniref:Uncharacterized protein n=1 Tax=Arcella intermedia TaxID=1963864 RepID=A0A6B2LTE4_9EUKA